MSPTQSIAIETLSNGLTLIVEEIPNVESVAYELLIPGGILSDPQEKIGSSLILAELTSRGAGPYDNRQLSDAFDSKGIRHSESAGHDRFGYRGSLVGDSLGEALKLVAFMVREPRLPQEDVENIRSILLQDIAALKDNPARRVLVELSQRYYPDPYSRPGMGTISGLEACSRESLETDWRKRFAPQGSVLSVAGKCRMQTVRGLVEESFSTWSGKADVLPPFGKLPAHKDHHIQVESAQLQIALAYPSAPFGHSHYFATKLAVGVLSGGMFGRLFTEVREKRGLVYSVYARHSSTKEYGTMLAYAGTTPERAQETLEVMVKELRGVKGSVSADELRRAKANLKASLVIGEESSSSRASSNAQDWWLDRRVRTLDEILSKIDVVGTKEIDESLEMFPSESFLLLTLGGRELDVSVCKVK